MIDKILFSNNSVSLKKATVSCLAWRALMLRYSIMLCKIVFKKNGPPTNSKFQIHNIAHARLLVHKMIQWNHINMLYFEIKYVIEWNEGFIIVASMSLKIEITIKVMYTKFIETGYKIYRNKINKKAKSNKPVWSRPTSRCSVGCSSMGLRKY